MEQPKGGVQFVFPPGESKESMVSDCLDIWPPSIYVVAYFCNVVACTLITFFCRNMFMCTLMAGNSSR